AHVVGGIAVIEVHDQRCPAGTVSGTIGQPFKRVGAVARHQGGDIGPVQRGAVLLRCVLGAGTPVVVVTAGTQPFADDRVAIEADLRLLVAVVATNVAVGGPVQVDAMPVQQGLVDGAADAGEYDFADA